MLEFVPGSMTQRLKYPQSHQVERNDKTQQCEHEHAALPGPAAWANPVQCSAQAKSLGPRKGFLRDQVSGRHLAIKPEFPFLTLQPRELLAGSRSSVKRAAWRSTDSRLDYAETSRGQTGRNLSLFRVLRWQRCAYSDPVGDSAYENVVLESKRDANSRVVIDDACRRLHERAGWALTGRGCVVVCEQVASAVSGDLGFGEGGTARRQFVAGSPRAS